MEQQLLFGVHSFYTQKTDSGFLPHFAYLKLEHG
jgi:hypothetical protein